MRRLFLYELTLFCVGHPECSSSPEFFPRRAVQLLLGHTKTDSTVSYLGVELEDAFANAEAIEIQRTGPSSLTARSGH
jgi:hypothetical protein